MQLPDFLDNLAKRDIVLASGSPRRRELLGQLGLTFCLGHAGDIDETYPADLAAVDVAPYLSRLKADHYRRIAMQPNDLVICADTVVIIDDTVLGKPTDEADACRMLSRLSGRTHRVVTGITLEWNDGSEPKRLTDRAITEVTFAQLSREEIRWYVENYKPLDKAGAYGIQEWIGAAAVSRIDGSYSNVMGLPLHLLYEMLLKVR